MADAPLPANLRLTTDITRFLNRANQLRAYKPAIAYWCDYCAVVKIMKSQLHKTDPECYKFTAGLIERLEKIKADNAADETICDDIVGQALVERFALETFERAEKVLRLNKVTRTTADTYDAAATFFLVSSVWSELDDGLLEKIKYAKWNAARILRSLRDGKDPNESNPQLMHEPNATLGLDELEARNMDFAPMTTVEDGSDHSTEFTSVKPLDLFSVPPPIVALQPENSMQNSIPDFQSPGRDSKNTFEAFVPSPLNQSPVMKPAALPLDGFQHMLSSSPVARDLQTHVDQHTEVPASRPISPEAMSMPHVSSTPSALMNIKTETEGRAPNVEARPSPRDPVPNPAGTAGSHAVSSAMSGTRHGQASAREGDIALAQKHAKWAISALNFDDIPTAIKELRKALNVLTHE